MLRNGLFHAIVPEEEGGRNGLSKSTIAEDKETCNDFQDSDNARYIFVSIMFSSASSITCTEVVAKHTEQSLIMGWELGRRCLMS